MAKNALFVTLMASAERLILFTLQVAQMPRSPKLMSFIQTTMDGQPITLPLAHAQGVIN